MTPDQKLQFVHQLLDEVYTQADAALEGKQDRSRGQPNSLKFLSERMRNTTPFFSQHGQDQYIDRVLSHKQKGVFVDIGGYDGLTGSNTLFFEVFRGWTGLLIEPSLTHLATAKSFRRCPCLGLALDAEAGELDFLEVTSGYKQMSGLLSGYDPKTLEFVRANPNHVEEIKKVPTQPLAEVLNEHNLHTIDYISLDVEGNEPAILQDFPFDDFDIHWWSIENNQGHDAVYNIMAQNGYELEEFISVDEIYRKNNIRQTKP